MDSKKRVTRKNFMGDIDRLMMDLSSEPPHGGSGQWSAVSGQKNSPRTIFGATSKIEVIGEGTRRTAAHPLTAPSPLPYAEFQTPENRETVPATKTKALGFIVLAIVVILSWLPLILPFY
jgi:hypothetical protein